MDGLRAFDQCLGPPAATAARDGAGQSGEGARIDAGPESEGRAQPSPPEVLATPESAPSPPRAARCSFHRCARQRSLGSLINFQ